MQKQFGWIYLSRIFAGTESLAVLIFIATLAGENFGLGTSSLMVWCIALIPALALMAMLMVVVGRWLGSVAAALVLAGAACGCAAVWRGAGVGDLRRWLIIIAPGIVTWILVFGIHLGCRDGGGPTAKRTVVWVLAWMIVFVLIGVVFNPP